MSFQVRLLVIPPSKLSERFGKIMQDRASYSINRTDTSIDRSKQFDTAISASKISALSSGEFVGMVADNPQHKIELKTFYCEIINYNKALQQEQEAYQEMPVFRALDSFMVQCNCL
ncbi:hypothetical protein [Dyadobacter sp. LHD-138]|uniref:hypothetical protein n=1 Tax=Dyadobacter sp. LHD-138 TaxID=3071413 RepID=UPI0027DF1E5D|nr:hypothetical protein [Dyadobacter sp. LHD-138]MDQ6482407.1 hypothetical protein [Dyadobacter sp. LHD-138]